MVQYDRNNAIMRKRKLTNHLRDVILSAMLADVPQINYVEKATIALQARLLKKIPT